MLVVLASEAAPIRKGTIYVAPADQHLLISDNHIHLSRRPEGRSARWSRNGYDNVLLAVGEVGHG